MGDKSLMKKLSILLVLLSSFVWSGSLSSEEITNMVTKIKKEREGIKIGKLENTMNPFRLNKKRTVETNDESGFVEPLPSAPEYQLQAILNHAAFINKKWYKRGDTLGSYRVGYIGRSSVTLTSKSGNKTLLIKKRKKMFIKLN